MLTRNQLKAFCRIQHKKNNIYECYFEKLLVERNVLFKKQFIIPPYIVDFYLRRLGIAIEIDGGIHKKTYQRDCSREEYIQSFGIIVMRFKTYESGKMEDFIDNILSTFKKINTKRKRKINRVLCEVKRKYYCAKND